MPVEDHPVHVLTKQGADARYGCWNLGAHKPRYFTFNWRLVEHRMSTECRYDKSLSDLKCEGCKHRGSGEAYDLRVRTEGK